MTAVLHIGPPKTATTSLQESVIPHLGRPYQIKPDWVRSLIRNLQVQVPQDLPFNVIVSDESIGEFGYLPPTETSEKLRSVIGGGRVIYSVRDPLEYFYSLYRQKLVNTVLIQDKTLGLHGRYASPRTADSTFDVFLGFYRDGGRGFFATI